MPPIAGGEVVQSDCIVCGQIARSSSRAEQSQLEAIVLSWSNFIKLGWMVNSGLRLPISFAVF